MRPTRKDAPSGCRSMGERCASAGQSAWTRPDFRRVRRPARPSSCQPHGATTVTDDDGVRKKAAEFAIATVSSADFKAMVIAAG
jgi:hypothetical protein